MRFGGDKLRADLVGLPLAQHAARTMAGLPLAWRFAVIGAGEPPPGFRSVTNPDPAGGQGGSLALGVAAARAAGAAAVLVMLADMPFVSSEHLQRVLARRDGPDTLVASGHGERRMPPALLGCYWFPTLEGLTGDRGARDLLDRAVLVPAEAHELVDIDRPDDLAAARRYLEQSNG